MPIRFTCPGCKASYAVDESLAGKQARCKVCKHPIFIPSDELPAAPKSNPIGQYQAASDLSSIPLAGASPAPIVQEELPDPTLSFWEDLKSGEFWQKFPQYLKQTPQYLKEAPLYLKASVLAVILLMVIMAVHTKSGTYLSLTYMAVAGLLVAYGGLILGNALHRTPLGKIVLLLTLLVGAAILLSQISTFGPLITALSLAGLLVGMGLYYALFVHKQLPMPTLPITRGAITCGYGLLLGLIPLMLYSSYGSPEIWEELAVLSPARYLQSPEEPKEPSEPSEVASTPTDADPSENATASTVSDDPETNVASTSNQAGVSARNFLAGIVSSVSNTIKNPENSDPGSDPLNSEPEPDVFTLANANSTLPPNLNASESPSEILSAPVAENPGPIVDSAQSDPETPAESVPPVPEEDLVGIRALWITDRWDEADSNHVPNFLSGTCQFWRSREVRGTLCIAGLSVGPEASATTLSDEADAFLQAHRMQFNAYCQQIGLEPTPIAPSSNSTDMNIFQKDGENIIGIRVRLVRSHVVVIWYTGSDQGWLLSRALANKIEPME